MSDSQRQFQIHLPGLLKVLAESLYSSKKVGIRELLQNAHDSCVRRQVEGKEVGYRARVEIDFDLSARKIIITDNGSGLTEDEVTEYLATIGRSYTRQLGEDLAILRPEEASRLVGQFGLGFLSAFLIAEDVTLITRSYKADSRAIRWQSSGDVHYNVTPVDEAPIGTRVELIVKQEASFLLNERVMLDTVQTYADFLNMPIHVAGSSRPVNAMQPPWMAVDTNIAIQEYINRTFGHMQPLAIIALADQEVSIGHDSITVPLEGFLFVPPGTVASIQEYGDVNIFIRRMFITENHTQLLPEWAKFVRGVVDSPYLQPTASREDLQQDDMFFKVQKALEEQLSNGLKDIARTDPLTWRRIVRGHRNLIMGWAVKDDRFFHEVADIVTFKTAQGDRSLPDYLDETGGTIYFITREMGSQQDQLLGAGYGAPVIDASRFAEPTFLQKYASEHPNVKLVQMDGDANQLMQSVPEQEFASLLDYFRTQGVRARIVSFKPDDVPAIISYPKDAEFIKETRDALDKGELPGPFAGLVGDYMNQMNVNDDMLKGTLHINAGSGLIQRLAGMKAGAGRDAALELVYQMARLFAGRMLETSDVTHAFRMSAASIQNLLDVDDESDS